MAKIGLKDARPGMILNADVSATGAPLLLAAGVELTEHHLRTFRMWGVVEVDVKGVSRDDLAAQAAAQLAPGDLEAVETRVRALFRHADASDPLIQELAWLTRSRLIARAAGGGTDVP